MNGPEALKILFVINPISGGKKKQDWEASIREFFLSQPHSIEIFLLNGQTDLESVQHWVKTFEPDRVVAVGGDGTVSLVAKILLGTKIPLGILPAGSANGMAKELDIPADVTEGLQYLLSAEIKPADVIRVNNQHICLHLSDIGMNAQLVKHFEEGKLRGKWGYARVLLKVLWNKTAMNVRIQALDNEIDRKAFMVVLANATKYGTGAVINPEGSLYDGYFEVVIIRRLALSEIIKAIVRPRPFNPEKFEVIQARSVNIQTSHRVPFQVDGEYLGKVNKVNATIEKSALLLLVPKLQ